MKSRWYLFFLFIFSFLRFAAAEAETTNSLPLESFGNGLDPRWRIECVAEGDHSFQGPLNQYKFHQEQGLNIIEDLNQSLKDAFGESFSMHAGVEEGAPSWLYSDPAAYTNLGLPSFMPLRVSLSEQQLSIIEACRQSLQDAGWHPDDTLYVQSSLEALYQRHYRATMGNLQTKEEYLRAMMQHEGVATLNGSEIVVVIAAEIDGYPIVPTLLGSYSDDDVPIYARILLGEDELLYLDLGCSYVLEASNTVDATPLAYEDAVKIAAQHGYQQWQMAWAAMASETAGGFDYLQFWQAYDPHFVLRIVRAVPSYYAKNNILSPGWQIDCEIEVLLSHDDALTDAERHAYVPEMITASYIIDAFTGDIVQ